jgi:diadenosine tetraphosphate (Ap4A) HIT family hydrolase
MGILALLLIVGQCECDLADAQKMAARQCGLCREAEKQSADASIFFLKDINPRKPNRWLALPRKHGNDHHPLQDMPPAERAALWTAAVAKARELWGDEDWGIAYNGDNSRTQCHAHVHIGKLLKGVERENFVVVKGPAQIPAPKDGAGLWIHPVGKWLHVHTGEQITETVLLR